MSLIMILTLPMTFVSCGDDEPDEPLPPTWNTGDDDDDDDSDNEFAKVLGYWMNDDGSRALEFVKNGKLCTVKTYIPNNGKWSNYESTFSSINGSFSVGYTYGGSNAYGASVTIKTVTSTRMLLSENSNIPSSVYNRITESEFSDYLSGSSSDKYEGSPILGTWKGKDYDVEFTITLYADGRAFEEWSSDYDSGSESGTFEYKDSKLQWNVDGVLVNSLGDEDPFTVSKLTSTSMTLKSASGYSSITFRKVK